MSLPASPAAVRPAPVARRWGDGLTTGVLPALWGYGVSWGGLIWLYAQGLLPPPGDAETPLYEAVWDFVHTPPLPAGGWVSAGLLAWLLLAALWLPVLQRGTTASKRLWGLRLYRWPADAAAGGSPCGLGRTAARELLKLAFWYLLPGVGWGVDMLLLHLEPQRRLVADRLLGTVVGPWAAGTDSAGG